MILWQFQVHCKMDGNAQRFPAQPNPIHSLLHYQHLPSRAGNWWASLTHHHHPESMVHLRFTLGLVLSMGLDKRMTRVIKSSFTALKILHAPSIHSSPYPNPWWLLAFLLSPEFPTGDLAFSTPSSLKNSHRSQDRNGIGRDFLPTCSAGPWAGGLTYATSSTSCCEGIGLIGVWVWGLGERTLMTSKPVLCKLSTSDYTSTSAQWSSSQLCADYPGPGNWRVPGSFSHLQHFFRHRSCWPQKVLS